MKNFIQHHPWKIIEEQFHSDHHQISESLFSIGNGSMGQRGNFEEAYSGKSLPGTYLAGIYYPDKTRVGWWKNGYPSYFAKVLNAPNWAHIRIWVNNIPLDLAVWKVSDFKRVLDMQYGLLERSCTVQHENGPMLQIYSQRYCHYEHKELGMVRYQIKVLSGMADIAFSSGIDGDVMNADANYGEQFWHRYATYWEGQLGHLSAKTKKSDFHVHYTVGHLLELNQIPVPVTQSDKSDKCIDATWSISASAGDLLSLEKFVAIYTSFSHPGQDLATLGSSALPTFIHEGYDLLLESHQAKWAEKWQNSDIRIDGDVAAQQGIRFNIFQLNQTYSGEDPRLNIGPKGFTGEKYGGSTYWDTEAYCLPFYLATAPPKVGKNLLLYRYKHLLKAIENAEKLGFTHGAALYPMVTMTGEECHNEWEITFEEIHRNGAIAYAIKDYIDYTGDDSYMSTCGLEVLIAIARFWVQRAHFANPKNQYVIHGVTGPNEYENNINNNWYTNYLAIWCLTFAHQRFSNASVETRAHLVEKLDLGTDELAQWLHVADHMFLPRDEHRMIWLQQEGFLDKEIKDVGAIPAKEIPLHQHWSWDRILRSCYIKQADVLQGLYLFEDDFSSEEIERNFNFYEPMTVHESSLSPCVHAILAARIGQLEKSYQMYLRTARLDLDDYNNDTADGCHITSMAGTWMSIIKGFAGVRWNTGTLSFTPQCPDAWDGYDFKIQYRNRLLQIAITKGQMQVRNEGKDLEVLVNNRIVYLAERKTTTVGL
ncbi:MAG: glycoside hydrolase family 65 protein [Saprospiraceae bacterium]|nr:glycoside hydrolase family 65 protein [Saprospiraceae bacterium]